ncbi:hypothetical protein HRI_004172600 [Hibiscus trionum]|uniref:Glutamate--ammonia ligase n=1 Tax=Hibiscus trionum TaxID=183268 RepID=A0A9W7MK67_HIBTR|nr:hypothetical protein HRI_004172600 [Hibiscus trionum]
MDVTPYTDKIIAEYVWIGGSGIDMRSKSRTLSKPVEHPSELPKWNYDGSSTGQAPGDDSEVILSKSFFIFLLSSKHHFDLMIL